MGCYSLFNPIFHEKTGQPACGSGLSLGLRSGHVRINSAGERGYYMRRPPDVIALDDLDLQLDKVRSLIGLPEGTTFRDLLSLAQGTPDLETEEKGGKEEEQGLTTLEEKGYLFTQQVRSLVCSLSSPGYGPKKDPPCFARIFKTVSWNCTVNSLSICSSTSAKKVQSVRN